MRDFMTIAESRIHVNLELGSVLFELATETTLGYGWTQYMNRVDNLMNEPKLRRAALCY